jgi:hypothetical protein
VFERAWARFFDREILKLLRKGVMTPDLWSILMTKAPPTLLDAKPCHTSNGLGWDYQLMHAKAIKDPLAYLKPFWVRFPPGSFALPSRRRHKKQTREKWSPLMWIISQTPAGCPQAAEIWTEAQRYSPSITTNFSNETSIYPLRLALDKGHEHAWDWVETNCRAIENEKF